MTFPWNGHTALVVEDDARTLLSIREHLTRSGFRVRSATNGWEALKHFKEGPIDVVISELTIADMDGCSLREKFLMDPGMRDVPFVFIVPEQQSGKQIRALRLGVDDCVMKPFDPIVIVARVEAVLARRRAYEEMVRVDPLTRVLNRPTLEREITQELARVARYGRFGSLALMDLDDFANLNAGYGYVVGDLLLTCLGGIILTSTRTVDIAGRIHGEEFLLFLPETRKEDAVRLVQRILERFMAMGDGVVGLQASFSSGIVETPADGADLSMLYARVSQAVHHAKQGARGKTALWRADLAEAFAASVQPG